MVLTNPTQPKHDPVYRSGPPVPQCTYPCKGLGPSDISERGRSGLLGPEHNWVADTDTGLLGSAWGLLAAEEGDSHQCLSEWRQVCGLDKHSNQTEGGWAVGLGKPLRRPPGCPEEANGLWR